MFGIKIKRIKTANQYTIESLYEAIKDKTFTAGTPELTKHGFTTLITFPALDRHNQVQILAAGKNKFQIQKAEAAGLDNMAVNAVLDHVTDGLSGLRGVVGGTAKHCEELVEITTKELDALGL